MTLNADVSGDLIYKDIKGRTGTIILILTKRGNTG
jgi:hypothetical protein